LIIDAHMHVGVWDHPDFLGRECDVSDALAVLRASEVDGAVMVPTDRCDNEHLLAEMRAAGAGFAGPLWFVAWARPCGDGLPGDADLAWVRGHIGQVAGVKIHPSLARRRVTDPGFAPALRLAAEHALVVMVHCGRWQEMASYRFAIEAARAHPEARFLLCHAGGDTPVLATAAAEMVADTGVGNVWFEFSGLREYWVIERNVALIGAERYLIGSDYNLAHPLMYVGAVRGMDLDEAAKRAILGENARALFGLPLGARD
jgi:predicted TIM-barrel fold metal-dependent hydrolase